MNLFTDDFTRLRARISSSLNLSNVLVYSIGMKRERDSLENVNVCTYFLNGADFLLLFLLFLGIVFLFFLLEATTFGVFFVFQFREKWKKMEVDPGLK